MELIRATWREREAQAQCVIRERGSIYNNSTNFHAFMFRSINRENKLETAIISSTEREREGNTTPLSSITKLATGKILSTSNVYRQEWHYKVGKD